jgi:hypothetical protein
MELFMVILAVLAQDWPVAPSSIKLKINVLMWVLMKLMFVCSKMRVFHKTPNPYARKSLGMYALFIKLNACLTWPPPSAGPTQCPISFFDIGK